MKTYFFAILVMVTLQCIAQNETQQNGETQQNTDHSWTPKRPDGHGPLSIMGDHTHHKGQWMVSLQYMQMQMKQLAEGTEDISNSKVFDTYMAAPQKMVMQMQMLGLMYAPSNRISLMAMIPFITKDMQVSTMMDNMLSNSRSQGIGDIKISSLYGLLNKKRWSIVGQLGLSLPTGDINAKGTMSASSTNATIMAYPMQLGSGSIHLFASLVASKQFERFSIGIQPTFEAPLHRNSQNYKLGNTFTLSDWVSWKVSNWVSLSASTQYQYISAIEGENAQLNRMMAPTANTKNSGRRLLNYGIGSNFYVPQGPLKNLRVLVEAMFPLYQSVSGIQLKQVSSFAVGVHYSW